MNPFAVPPLIAFLLNVLLVLWVYSKATKGPVRNAFILWNSWLALWNLGVMIGYMIPTASEAYSWYKLVSSFVVCFIGPLFLNFVMAVAEWQCLRSRLILTTAFASAGCLSLICFTTQAIMTTVHHYFWGYYPLAGRFEFFFGASFSITVLYALLILFRSIKRHSGYQRNQLSYLFIGALICFGSGFTNFLPLYGVTVYPLGNLMNAVYSVLVAYSMIEFGFMDIRLALRTGLAYTCLTGALTLVYMSLVAVLKNIAGFYKIEETYAFYTAAMPLTILLSPAIKSRMDPLIQKATFWSTDRYAAFLRDFNGSLGYHKDLKASASHIIYKINDLFKITKSAIYLRDKDTGFFRDVLSTGDTSEFSLAHPVVNALNSQTNLFVQEKWLWEWRRLGEADDAPTVRAVRQWPFAIAVAFRDDRDLSGFLALGPKKSNEMYSKTDLDLLTILAVPAYAALQSTLFMERWKTNHPLGLKAGEDMDLIGILATELSHELSKPLTHILNAQHRLEATMEGPAHKDLLKIERETQRASEILDGFAMLSTQNKLQRISYPIQDLIEEALDLSGIREDSSIKIVKAYDRVLPLSVNPGQISQVLTNLIQNAWQAMPKGGHLRISLSQEDPTDFKKSWVVIKIEDTGEGIPPHLLSRVFELLFTTRRESGGRGIGLAISQAMVHRHLGTVTIESPIDRLGGTKVTIRLPRHAKGETSDEPKDAESLSGRR